jgi:hypothetical protein
MRLSVGLVLARSDFDQSFGGDREGHQLYSLPVEKEVGLGY